MKTQYQGLGVQGRAKTKQKKTLGRAYHRKKHYPKKSQGQKRGTQLVTRKEKHQKRKTKSSIVFPGRNINDLKKTKGILCFIFFKPDSFLNLSIY